MFLWCVSHASFANDICGQPLPPFLVHPWNFFDGKLFQHKLSIMSRPGSTLFARALNQTFNRIYLENYICLIDFPRNLMNSAKTFKLCTGVYCVTLVSLNGRPIRRDFLGCPTNRAHKTRSKYKF